MTPARFPPTRAASAWPNGRPIGPGMSCATPRATAGATRVLCAPTRVVAPATGPIAMARLVVRPPRRASQVRQPELHGRGPGASVRARSGRLVARGSAARAPRHDMGGCGAPRIEPSAPRARNDSGRKILQRWRLSTTAAPRMPRAVSPGGGAPIETVRARRRDERGARPLGEVPPKRGAFGAFGAQDPREESKYLDLCLFWKERAERSRPESRAAPRIDRVSPRFGVPAASVRDHQYGMSSFAPAASGPARMSSRGSTDSTASACSASRQRCCSRCADSWMRSAYWRTRGSGCAR